MDEDEDAVVRKDESVPVISAGDLDMLEYFVGDSTVATIDLTARMDQGDSRNDVAKEIDLPMNVIEPPPRKKARTIGSVVAQTATAVTIGAIVTWSALAFS
jgi:hypothetical protein